MVAGSIPSEPIELDRDLFMRQLIASIGHLNEGLLGSDVAGAYVMNVGLSMGAAIEAEYKRAWGIDRPFTRDEYAHVIVDLKQRIRGNFSLVSNTPEKVVVRTTSCPFDAFVRQSPSLCFMTSSVFGGIAARNLGYAKVVLHKRIALGDDGCYATVHLQKTQEAEAGIGREYFPDIDAASPDIAEQLRLMDSVRALRSELTELRSGWEEVIHSAAEAIAAINAAGQIDFANGSWRDLLGVEGHELVRGEFANLAHPDDRGRAREIHRRLMAGERIVGDELRLLHRLGTWRLVVISGGPIRDESGRVRGAMIIARDVTYERETQRLKDEFLVTASHELRTPIASVKGLAQLLLRMLDRHGSIDPDVLSARLRTLVHEADRLALASRDILDASRYATREVPLDLETSELNSIAEASVTRQELVLQEAGARRELRFRPADRLIPVTVDRARIEQALDNLLSNAVKYSPAGGTIEVSVQVEGDRGCVYVVDEGIGIPESELGRLFVPFARASNAAEAHLPGLGLGLHLARRLVEAHGGEIVLESAVARGTTAIVRLPLAIEA
ncbi:MAG: ATP-binding protein [Chloroflexota bacterium]|nr:ATP-binding protein [Chloroflexota bacterium]